MMLAALIWLLAAQPAQCSSAAISAEWAKRPDDQLLTQVRSYPACELEGTLPKAPLAEWLKSVVGSDAKLTWQVSTELKWTGDPPPPETPLYVRVTWWSYSKQFGGQILLNVAVLRADGASRLEPPTLDYILAGPTGGSSRGRDEVVPTLSELALRIARRPSRPTAKAK